MTLPKYIALSVIVVASSAFAYADSTASEKSIPLSPIQDTQRGMMPNRAPMPVTESVRFESSLRRLPRETSALVIRSDGARPPEIGRDQGQTSAILPEPNAAVLFGIGLLFLIFTERTVVRERHTFGGQGSGVSGQGILR